MKKVLMLIMGVFIFSLSFATVKAEDLIVYVISTTDNCSLIDSGSHGYYVSCNYTITSDDLPILTVSLGDLGYNTIEDPAGSIVIDAQDSSNIYFKALYVLYGSDADTDNNGEIEKDFIIDLELGVVTCRNYTHLLSIDPSDYSLDLTIAVYQDFITPPDDFLADWLAVSNISLSNQTERVLFYNMYLYDIQYSVNGSYYAPIAPTRTGYVFTGWRTITGVSFDFEVDSIQEDFYNDSGDFLLYASFINTDGYGTLDPDVVENTPDGFIGFLSIVGLDNETGFMLVFVILNIIIIVLSLLLKLDYGIPLLISMILYGLFIFLGTLRIYVIVILALLYILFIVGKFVIGGRSGGEE